MKKSDKKTIAQVLAERILILDGAMGTQIQNYNLKESDYGCAEYYGCNEYLNITNPDIIVDIHNHYFENGADIVESNSFGCNALVLAEYGLADKTYELAKLAGELAKKSANHFTTENRTRYAAGSVGPTNKLLNIGSNIAFAELKESYKTQIRGLIDGGVDLILLETFPDTSNIKAAGTAFMEICAEKKVKIPLMISVTIERNGTMLAGQKIDALYHSIKHFNPLSVGLNCGLGAAEMEEHVRALSEICGCFISIHPNAGLPDENGVYQETPAEFAEIVKKMAEKGYLNIVGGCCGTSPEHIRLLDAKLSSIKPRQPLFHNNSIATGIEIQEFTAENRPVIVGERSNMSGSLKFKKLIRNKKFEAAAEIAKLQASKGAQVIDINLSDTESDELQSIQTLYPLVLKKIKAPIMIDSTGGTEIFETALQYIQGKAIINSISFENVSRFENITVLAQKYGAMLLVMLIDQTGMATTLERKIQVADMIYAELTGRFGFPEEDIVFDCLVFPVATGDENYYKAAQYTIEAIEAIKKKYPRTKTSLGVSNGSFGLPEAGREALNSAYLYYATKAGLDMAIVNSEKIVRYSSLSDEEKMLCNLLLFDNTADNVKKFVEFYSGKKAKAESIDLESSNLTAEEKLAVFLQEGLKTGLEAALNVAMTSRRPLAVVNEVLMPAMGEVGRRFNANELTVIEVLQSAEVMKAAVDYLKPFMEKNETAAKGKMVLATVKGDVHDIGKNLVDIVLSNNGYEIVDIGIKVDSEALINAVREHQPQVIGLSGLLVKSAQQMMTTAEDLKNAGIHIPIFVGGAALSARFALTRIKPRYDGPIIFARDAVEALSLMDRYFSADSRETFLKQLVEDQHKLESGAVTATETAPAASIPVVNNDPVVIPPDFDLKIVENISVDDVWPLVNRQMLFGKHFGLKGNYAAKLAAGDAQTVKITNEVNEVLALAKAEKLFEIKAVYRFVKAKKNGETVEVFNSDNSVAATFNFPRQSAGEKISLNDYLNNEDYLAMFCVTAGATALKTANLWKNEDKYAASHILAALSLEIAEATAEFLHRRIRQEWGIANFEPATVEKLLAAEYQGKRFSFGYGACPDMHDQVKLFKILEVTKSIGVELTEGMVMSPEASVSAVVFQSPRAKYFQSN